MLARHQTPEEIEVERKAAEAERARIDAIECPVCKSTAKAEFAQRNNNGVIGLGYASWMIQEYLICLDCGVHYHDLEKLKRNQT